MITKFSRCLKIILFVIEHVADIWRIVLKGESIKTTSMPALHV